MNLLIKAAGLFFFAEGVANLAYWNGDKHPWYFQAGRLIRTMVGLTLLLLG